MKASHVALAMAAWLGGVAAACAQTGDQLTITDAALEICVVDQSCYQQLHATGGAVPLRWRIVRGSLPQGLQLDAASGVVSGIAVSAAEYEVQIEVSDARNPPRAASRVFSSRTVPPLVMDWGTPPTLQATTISGNMTVSNNGRGADHLAGTADDTYVMRRSVVFAARSKCSYPSANAFPVSFTATMITVRSRTSRPLFETVIFPEIVVA